MASQSANLWVLLGLGLAGILIMTRKLKKVIREDFGAFIEKFQLLPPPPPPPPKAPHPLTGLTFAVSDVFDIDGYVTGFGHPEWVKTHGKASWTSPVVTALVEGGATCIGKTVVDELAYGISGENKHYGTPTNPTTPAKVPGGSSSGAAVAVAANLVDFSLGIDTVGGVRIPAGFCGILGFRPSLGAVSHIGIIPISTSLDTIGWFTKDPNILHRVGHVLLQLPYTVQRSPRQIIIADDCFQLLKIPVDRVAQVVIKSTEKLFGRQALKHENVEDYLKSKVTSLKEFHSKKSNGEFKTSTRLLANVMQFIQRHEFKHNHGEWISSVKPVLDPAISAEIYETVETADTDIEHYKSIRDEMRSAIYSLLKDDGILVIPTIADPPPKLGGKEILSEDYKRRACSLLSIASISGCCQVTIPLGFHNKCPVSVSFIARNGGDRFLLDTTQAMYATLQEQADIAAKSKVSRNVVSKEESAEIAKEKGNQAFKDKQWQKAIGFYTEAIKLSSKNATYYSNRALAYLELGSYLQAEADCTQAINLDKKVGLEGSSVGQWWLDMIGKTLDEGSTFERVGSRQLAGLLISVWVRNSIRAHVGDVDAAAVPCGFGRAIGNKGAVGLRLRVYDRVMCFVNCHFAAHLEAVNRRNADFDHVYRTMTFSRPTNLFNAAAAGSSAVQMLRSSTNVIGAHTAEGMPELSDADLVIFLGDFNYRLDDISYDEARDFISQRCFDWLRERDQLRKEMEAGNVFQGMREAVITFPPTYKFERHQAGLAGYDSSEKKRIPAWCDRILYRDSRSALVSECSLECPVVSSISRYEACMDVTDSDHKPVRCIFTVDIARVDESIRRQELGEILGSNEKIKYVLEELCKIPETIISTNNIILQNQDTSILRITNKCGKNDAFFEIICEGESSIKEDGQASDHCPRGSFGYPRWLEVTPAAGIIRPNHIAELSVHHDEFLTLEEFVDGVPQNSWCEDHRDKEVILVVKVWGRYTMETRNHRVRVRHCVTAKIKRSDPELNSTRQIQGTVLHRSNIQSLSSSYDVVDHLRNLHSP